VGAPPVSGPAVFSERAAGVLLPVASLPGRHGVGDLGAGADSFLDWCHAAGVGWWQVLPVGPVGSGNSPYASLSAFAGEPLYLSLELLAEEGWLETRDLRAPGELGKGACDYDAARDFKLPRLARAHERWRSAGGSRRKPWKRFLAASEHWLDGWLADLEGDERDVAAFAQFQFDQQWRRLRRRATERGVRLLGDLPIFVGADSVDVDQHPQLFRLDRKGNPKVVTGVPPDGFSADGQRWGHPHYAWRAHRKDGFAWWRRRFAQELERCDALRVDHFIGFHHAWEIPAGHRTARKGKWGRTPGAELLDAVQTERGELPLVAEDLGVVTPPVRALRDRYELPGMRILQFAFGEGGGYDRPHQHAANCVAYTGTHDNDTTAGWWRKLGRADKARARAYLGLPARGVEPAGAAWAMVCALMASPARTAVVPVQDLLGLGSEARVNLPGTPRGNWSWRVDPRALSASLSARFGALVEATERLRGA
jgi:4-alpha-glucanotransferase